MDPLEMEQLHAAALAYYEHGSPELQRLAWSFFQSMDTNGDKRISYSEFNDFLQHSGHYWILNDPNFFRKLDRNRDGGLDFEEVLTFYYIIKTRCVMCRGCSVYLCGLYFTCVACFDGADHNTYDLCAVCYRNWNFHHNHSYFLDNHILLRAKRCIPPPPSCLSPAMAPQPQSTTVVVTITTFNLYLKEKMVPTISSIGGRSCYGEFGYELCDYVTLLHNCIDENSAELTDNVRLIVKCIPH